MKEPYISLFVWFLSVKICISNFTNMLKTIKIPYELSSQNQLTMPLNFGKNPTTFLGIKFDKDYSHFFRLSYLNKPTIIKNITVYHTSYSTNISEVVDIISLGEYKINLKFYLFHYDVFPKSLGFAFSFNNNDFSIVHSLKQSNLIDHLSFSFVPKGEKGGDIYFGRIPSDIIKGKQKANCGVTKGIIWNCELKEVWVDDYKYINKYFMKIRGASSTLVPDDFFLYLQRTFFNVGNSLHFSGDSNTIFCGMEYINQVNGTISFIIGDYKFEIKLYDLFICDNERQNICRFQMVRNEKVPNQWELGLSIWNKYITTFDYENEEIQFFSESIFQKMFLKDSKTITIHKKISVLICILLLIYLTIFSIVLSFINGIYYKQ